MTDPALTECPNCQQSTLSKLVSAAGFQLKGSGWYVTDYSKKSQPSTSEVGSAAKTEGKTESNDTTKNSTDQTGSSKSGAGE